MVKDETGNRYGRLLVVERYDPAKHGGIRSVEKVAFWRCKCDCGNTAIVGGGSLRSGLTQSCGCLRRESRKVIDETGKTYGRLKVVERYNPAKHGPYYCASTSALWFCECECGNTSIVLGASLRSGTVRSCGCSHREHAREMGKARTGKHGTNLCSECKNRYINGGWHCLKVNKSLGFCNWNGTPHPKAKYRNYKYNPVKDVEFAEIGK